MKKYAQFTDEHDMFRKAVRDFCLKELAPHAEAWEAAREFPREVFKTMGDLGFIGCRYPEELGGAGGDIWHTAVLAEELPHSSMAGLAMAMLVQSDMATPIIGELGTDAQKEEFLIPAIRGEKIAALGVSEPGAGSDVAGIRTTAKRDGDDYIINGQKTWITNGTRADFITLAVRTDPDNRYGGISLILFPTDTPGFSVGKKLEKIGNHCSDTAELFFEDCRVPARYLLGDEGAGFYYIMQNFQGERLVGALTGTAGAQIVLDKTIIYCKERHAFDRPLTGFQVTRHKLVEMEAQLEACRALTYHAAQLFERGIPCQREISMAKMMVGETAMSVIDGCLQLHGGMGYVEEGPVARAWRDTRLLSIGGGTTEIMKEIISKVMGL
ncbi:acyl-CoA dehydrogenase [Bradymonadaceae bacterium TMQ3]|uniref:Acyl-CoA dehydrogenase n=1 Tax=Lujinxingia sediminis TaxID=2480984 RepID=A0ABY0CW50_9DELT|nr:acyl-CoA dehydrogenase family protein [Lujinxingia sediminis]RDV39864.1 acyl-CoA dehydrogenase [Bradymonadaceae bacterium TMQ3]RVU48092.1 acyl-CoA dehydrogenase [Lujinxingia sediminis]TXC77391.1 acyl-CoA dehydrogenase [Bradymonadales bacterium TMQ1]